MIPLKSTDAIEKETTQQGNEVMNYHVAIKFEDYTAQFSFQTPEERDEFIQINCEIHPEMEVICTEEKRLPNKKVANNNRS